MTRKYINIVVAGATGYVGLDLFTFCQDIQILKLLIFVRKKVLESLLIRTIKD